MKIQIDYVTLRFCVSALVKWYPGDVLSVHREQLVYLHVYKYKTLGVKTSNKLNDIQIYLQSTKKQTKYHKFRRKNPNHIRSAEYGLYLQC